MNGIFVFSIVLNLLFVGIEAIVGLTQHSLSLLSDAGHNLSDVFSLLLVLIAFQLAKVHPGEHYTYGLKKSSVLISLLNAILLLVAVGGIIIESIHKFSQPVDVNGVAVSWTAGVGILVNGLTAALLMHGQKQDINVRGAFLHMVADTLVSVGVVISGIIITWTGWNIVDPIVSLAIACVILFSTWDLLTDSLRLVVDGTPEGIEPEAVRQGLEQAEHVKEVHHIHIWAMSTTDNALTAHVVIDSLENMETVKAELKASLRQSGIAHSTLEFETSACHSHEHEREE
jgi:cobalt-zinc-cadmium efflux system protein